MMRSGRMRKEKWKMKIVLRPSFIGEKIKQEETRSIYFNRQNNLF